MKPIKPLSLHKKNQRSLTIEIGSKELKPRLHHSNPKPRPDHQRSSYLTTNYKKQSSTKHEPTRNFLKLKGDIKLNTLALAIPTPLHKSFGELKNDSLAKMISKRQPSLSKDSTVLKLKERKPRQRLSIDVYNKTSPDQKSYNNSTKAISRRRSTLISKMKSQVSEEFLCSQIVYPQPTKEVLKRVGHFLCDKEVEELIQIETVYFMNKKQKQYLGEENAGFDDKKGFYIAEAGDQMCYRFEIIAKLGKGSFGEVVKVFDHKKQETVALKIIRNRKTPNSQALIEYGILKSLNSGGAASQNIVRVCEAFRFRNHFCMTFELLSLNLYDLLKSHKFSPFSSQLIRRLSIQILSALIYLRRKNIIHCDIKPQNVLLKQIDKSGIKLIDFGSSCYSDERMYSYIQSRYYRAPEVILGYQYSFPIDMWSFGCVVAELKLTYPLFGGEDQKEQVGLISEVIGLPDKKFYSKTERGELYFQKGPLKDREGEVIIPNARPLKDLFEDSDFVEFLQKIFVWEPNKRINPIEALRHNWILKGIPEEIRNQHLEYLAEEEGILNGKREKGQSSTLSQQILSRNAN